MNLEWLIYKVTVLFARIFILPVVDYRQIFATEEGALIIPYKCVVYKRLMYAKSFGFNRLVFHTEADKMNILQKKYKARLLQLRTNWYNTDKTFYLGGMDL